MSSTALPKNKTCPRIVITPGEPAGIGPDLVLALAQQTLPAEIIACCDPDLLLRRSEILGTEITIEEFNHNTEATPNKANHIKVYSVKLPAKSEPGQLNPANAEYVLETLKMACAGCQQGLFDAMTTGPVQKSIINDAGIPFSGHTEYLAELCDAYPVMMLANDQARVALVTTHLPLSKVSQAINEEILEKTLNIVHDDLCHRFGIKEPNLYVCGLNPHAGEGGHLGQEEINIIEPVINCLRQKGMNLIGPMPADTVFTLDHLQQADVVVSMYHDQGLPALKALGFGETVNVTLGLPIIRTSVDHGTALDLAGSGKASSSSLLEAVKMAIDLTAHQQCSDKNRS